MTNLRDRIVEVLQYRAGPGRWVLGSGFLLAKGLVLTAAHNVAGDGSIVVRHLGPGRVDRRSAATEKRENRATIYLIADAAVADLALLEVHGATANVAPFRSRYLDLETVAAHNLRAWSVGFPLFKNLGLADGVVRDTRQADGHIKVGDNMVEGLLSLNVDHPPAWSDPRHSPWEGMSGAAVVVDDVVVGVITLHDQKLGPSVLTLTPLTFLDRLTDPTSVGRWRDALGIAPRAPRTDTVIHLPRLQPDLPSKTERDRWRASLLGDLEQQIETYGLAPTVVAAPAGLTCRGSRREFDEAVEFLRRMSTTLRLQPDRFVLVPSAADIDPSFWESHLAKVDHDAPEPCAGWPDRTSFEEVLDRFYGPNLRALRFAESAPWLILEEPGVKLAVAGFNSLIRRDCRSSTTVSVGNRQMDWFVSRLPERHEAGWLQIAVIGESPHPGGGLLDDGAQFLRRLGSRLHCVVYARGDPDFGNFGSLGLVGLPAVGSSYQFVEIERHRQRLRVWRRVIEDEAHLRWGGDTSISADKRTWRSGWLDLIGI